MLFLICHSALALSVAIWVCSLTKAATIPAGSVLFVVLLMLYASRKYCGYFVGLRVVHPSPN